MGEDPVQPYSGPMVPSEASFSRVRDICLFKCYSPLLPFTKDPIIAPPSRSSTLALPDPLPIPQDPVLDRLGCQLAPHRGRLHEWSWAPYYPPGDRLWGLAQWAHCGLPGEAYPLDRCQVSAPTTCPETSSFPLSSKDRVEPGVPGPGSQKAWAAGARTGATKGWAQEEVRGEGRGWAGGTDIAGRGWKQGCHPAQGCLARHGQGWNATSCPHSRICAPC